MRHRVSTLIATFAALVMISIPALAHHGDAAYNTTKVVTVKGTVTEFQFINPHVEIFMNVKNPDGTMTKWQGELTSPNHLAREGWSRHTLKPGQEITLMGYRAKNGAPSLRLQKVMTATGDVLYPVRGE